MKILEDDTCVLLTPSGHSLLFSEGELFVLKQDLARGYRDKTRAGHQERCFARPGRTYDSNGLAARDVEIDPIQNRKLLSLVLKRNRYRL